jgi:hypothetical protein
MLHDSTAISVPALLAVVTRCISNDHQVDRVKPADSVSVLCAVSRSRGFAM